MSDSLIPERPVQVSPTLACSIGLEPAILLQHLQGLGALVGEAGRGYHWTSTTLARLAEQLPFWSAGGIKRLLRQLDDMGLVIIEGETSAADQPLRIAINQKQARPVTATAAQPGVAQAGPASLGAARIPRDWQPDGEILAQLEQQGIPQHFALSLQPEFVLYWSDRGEAHHSWASKFLQHVSRRWQLEQQYQGAAVQKQAQRSERTTMEKRWQPSLDAIEILDRMGINKNFIDDAVPEFILYWEERGEEQNTWNSKFVTHVKRQWARYTHTLKNDTEPKPITADWQPDNDVFDVLTIANIDHDFARELVPEFVLFWRDRNDLNHSWNTKFLQHVKYHWARQKKATTQGDKADIFERLTDRSWAADLV